jgi:hypothetical protein
MGFGGYKTPVPGLFLSGSGTHPIAGINGMPGMNAAKTVIKTLKKETGRPVPGPIAASGTDAGFAHGNGAGERSGEPARTG